MSEGSNSTALYNVNSSVNADAETESIQPTSNEKVTKSPTLTNPGGELASEIDPHLVSAEFETPVNSVVNMTNVTPKHTVTESQVGHIKRATYSEMAKRNQSVSQVDQTSQQKEVSSKASRKITELRQDKGMVEKDDDVNGFIGVKRQRIRTKLYFISGIADNVGKEETIRFVNKKGIMPTLINLFPSKWKGTQSAKINNYER